MCTPAGLRHEPLSSPPPSASWSPAGASATTGRRVFSQILEATRPTTPACHSGSCRQNPPAGPASPATKSSASCSAVSTISAWIAWRSRLSASSCSASAMARPKSSSSRQRMPIEISSSRPAAFSRGPATNPRSPAVTCARLRPATSSSAAIPGAQRRAWMRLSPWCTSRRLFSSSCTRSATEPSATRSSRLSSLKSAFRPRRRSSPRSAMRV